MYSRQYVVRYLPIPITGMSSQSRWLGATSPGRAYASSEEPQKI